MFELYAHGLTFSFLLPCFCVALELSEVKMHVRSVADSGKESLGALETDAKWAWGWGWALLCVPGQSTLAGFWVRASGA